MRAAGAGWWPLAMARELDDAMLMLRANELELACRVEDRGSSTPSSRPTRADRERGSLARARNVGMLRRTSRGWTSPRAACTRSSIRARASPVLLELGAAADRIYMLDLPDERRRRLRSTRSISGCCRRSTIARGCRRACSATPSLSAAPAKPGAATPPTKRSRGLITVDARRTRLGRRGAPGD